jgi:hypothetical protein
MNEKEDVTRYLEMVLWNLLQMTRKYLLFIQRWLQIAIILWRRNAG